MSRDQVEGVVTFVYKIMNRAIINRVRDGIRSSLSGLLGVGFCVATAAMLSFFLKDSENIRFVAPIICLQVVILVSLLWGRVTGLIGTLLATLTFTLFLFPPIGSFAIHDTVESLMLFVLIGSSLFVVALVPNKSSKL
jgi:K+-sensing histidine kinase KdpD